MQPTLLSLTPWSKRQRWRGLRVRTRALISVGPKSAATTKEEVQSSHRQESNCASTLFYLRAHTYAPPPPLPHTHTRFDLSFTHSCATSITEEAFGWYVHKRTIDA
jgi:hypothetical protein